MIDWMQMTVPERLAGALGPSFASNFLCLNGADKEPAASRGVSNPSGQAGFSSA
jgi:hypothetical protein